VVSVHLRNATKLFGSAVAVDSVTLDVEAGELFFLLGPSGCGKTTCLRMIAGFYEPTSGDVLFGDRVVSRVSPHKRNTGMVFQNYALWPHLTVYQNVEYGLDVRRVPSTERRERVERALSVVHMADHAKKSPNQLSGGQQQRIALARALVIEPDVLLLDEPLSNLDAKLRIEMRQEIRRLHQEVGITAIYVTHDQSEALSMADRLAIMHQGRIVQIGTPREMYTGPASEFVAQFIGETNLLPGRVVEVGDGGPVTVETPLGRLTSAHSPRGIAVGDPVKCSVRPEAFVPAGTNDGVNRLTVTVESSMYLGAVEEFRLRSGDTALTVSLHNPGHRVFTAGDTVVLAVDPVDVVLVPSGSGAA